MTTLARRIHQTRIRREADRARRDGSTYMREQFSAMQSRHQLH